jgi:phospholipid/cholesterol/gamma-HCH transport system substrate-binding protein
MASQRMKFTVGLFVAGGSALAILAIIWLGMSRYLEEGRYYVTYFDESVQGLDRDSPVKYRGVPIGRVEAIGVAPDSRLIQVVMKIDADKPLDADIRAQLKTVGITGSMFIGLDRKEEGEIDRSPPLSFPSEYPVVPSKPSEITKLLQGLDEFLNHVRALDLKGISDKIKATLDNMDQMVADANLQEISLSVRSSLERLDGILDNERWDRILGGVEDASQTLNTLMGDAGLSLHQAKKAFARAEGMIADNEKTIQTAVKNFRKAAESADLILKKGASLVDGTDDTLTNLKRHLLVISQNLEKASENINQLTELLADQPSRLLLGTSPARRKLDTDVHKK